ncbi:hypothetical protein TRFO_05555 [Tritrichomonas foetus]|uniref:Uncharacterized protein n=1 Tax=Tritrichomonas foetus TaxID=1144522 RepID=A0A1J4K662_9EUKA|nr:hypothetical protein TRFO_05555 [Tritrichomonas foetus]|eukprot:OHT06368.1 hypothetical protein TRFO_05555 [Tritrichomonas foetus]
MDIQSIRLLLDYKADPNILFRNMSLLAYAAKTGNFQAIKLLLDAHADPHIGEPTPLETVIHYSSRECLAALLDGHEEDLLVPIKGRLLIEIALEAQTTLLSVVAVYTKRQFDEAKKKGETENLPVFPPKTLKRSRLKKLNAALKQNDYLLPVDIVRKSVLHIKSPWRPREKDDENEEAELVESMNLSLNSTMRSTRRAHLLETNGEDFGVPPTPFRYNDSQFPDSDDEDEETQSRSQSRSTTAASNVKRAFLTPNDSDDMSNDFHFHLMTPTSTPRTTRNKSPFA